MAKTNRATRVVGPEDEDDAKTIRDLDTQFQDAVRRHDVKTMDSILADDAVLITGRGTRCTKADQLQEARGDTKIYDRQDDTRQTVHVLGDIAVITALLHASGTDDGEPFDYQLWFSDVYTRTPSGWRYWFGQASLPLPR